MHPRSACVRLAPTWLARILVMATFVAPSAVTAVSAQATAPAVTVTDSTAQRVALARPAHRIVALSPQLVELAAAAGAGPALVGTVRGADTPPFARSLPRVGDAFSIDLEAIARLHPDLVLAWRSGTPPRQLAALRHLGIPVYWSETRRLRDIAATVRSIGVLAGTSAPADRWADAYDARLHALRQRYADKPPVRVFVQFWAQPLMTAGGTQLISQAITVCGGINPFAALAVPVATVSREAVVAADQQLIVADAANPSAFDAWRAFPSVAAVRHGQFFLLDPALLPRMGARTLDGVQQLCAAMDRARPHTK